MNPSNITHIQTVSTNKIPAAKTIKDGSQVLVRVIADKGNGKYEGSIAGMRTIFSAKNSLPTGLSFVANITVKDGKILINPKDKIDSVLQNKIDVISFAGELSESENIFETIENQNLAQFISQFSLPPDKLSLHLLLQFKQMDMKLEPGVLNQIRNLAVKYAGKEKKVSELLALLVKKGVWLSEEEIDELLNELEINLEEKELNSETKSFSNKNEFSFQKIIKDYFSLVFSGVNQDKIGILTVLNQFNQKTDENQNKKWIFLPFEIIEAKETKYEINGKGCFRLMLNQQKELNLMNVECNYKNSDFIFLLEFDKNRIRKIKFNVRESEEEKEILIQKLKDLFQNQSVNVEWQNRSAIEGTACETEEIFIFSGEV